MNSGIKKRLGFLLACLLVIAPLGRAMADSHYPPSLTHEQTSESMMHSGHLSHHDMANHQCAECSDSHTCDSTDCTCNHCTTHITLLLPHLAAMDIGHRSQSVLSKEHDLDSQHPSPLERPPRS